MLLVAAAYYAATGINELNAANKQMELEQLKGVELMERQSQAFQNFHTQAVNAAGAMASFSRDGTLLWIGSSGVR